MLILVSQSGLCLFFVKTFGKAANLIGLSYRGVSFLDFVKANNLGGVLNNVRGNTSLS